MVYVNNGLVGVDIAVANLQIEMAIGIRTYPGLEMDGRALASEIRKRHKIAVAAVLAFWENSNTFRPQPHPHPWDNQCTKS